MIHPNSELRFIDPTVGYGVFATAFIPKGTLIWVLDRFDRILSHDEVTALPDLLLRQVETYAYVDSAGRYILCWDFGRYMNHSCTPATRGVGEAFEVAVRDLHPGDQLTCEYGILNLSRNFDCRCGTPACRGTIGVDDLDRHCEAWDKEATEAFALAGTVPQPLLPYALVKPEEQYLVDAITSAQAIAIPSHRDYQLLDRPTVAGDGGSGLWAAGPRT